MTSRARGGLVSAVALGLCVWFATPHANACGSAIGIETDDHTMLVSQAERALGDGKYLAAAVDVAQTFPGLKLYKAGTGPLADRSLRILSLAVTRSNGAVNVAGFSSKTDADKAKNLEWAVTTLRALNAKRPNNPSLQSDLGEAMSRVDKDKDEAQKLLGGLADKDLLATAEGYAALAKLRASDKTASEAFLKRCQAMTKSQKVCALSASVAS